MIHAKSPLYTLTSAISHPSPTRLFPNKRTYRVIEVEVVRQRVASRGNRGIVGNEDGVIQVQQIVQRHLITVDNRHRCVGNAAALDEEMSRRRYHRRGEDRAMSM